MIKRFAALLVLLVLMAGCIPVQAAGLSKPERYEAALTELKNHMNDMGVMSLAELQAHFAALGTYEQSMYLYVYTSALLNVEQAMYTEALDAVELLRASDAFCTFLAEDEDLGSLDELQAYASARRCEYWGDYAGAASFYTQCADFLDSFPRLLNLQGRVPTPTPRPTRTAEPAKANIRGRIFRLSSLDFVKGRGMQLHWQDMGEGVSYRVYRRWAKANVFSPILDTGSTSCVDDFPSRGGYVYYYYVEATDSFGNVLTSDVLHAMVR